MPIQKPLHYLTIAEAGALLRARQLTSSQLIEAFLTRIDAVDDKINSYITVLAERARSAAKRADDELANGRDRGALHGIPFAVKDNYHVAGVRTTGGSKLMLNYIPEQTSTAVAKLEEAGAILLGKLNTWEYGTGNANVYHDLPFPVARNPWDTARFTGGSSTGAGVAVAAGTAMFAMGSDTGGSVRLPAAATGVAGLKATYGLISRAHCLPNCWSLDYIGPLAWTVEDIALVLNVLIGKDPDDPTTVSSDVHIDPSDLTLSLSGKYVGFIRDLGEDTKNIDPDNLAALDAAAELLRSLGAKVEEAGLPSSLTAYRVVARTINWAESYSLHAQDYKENGQLMGRALREKMMMGAAVTADDYLAAQRQRGLLAKQMQKFLSRFDAVLLPNAFKVAPRFDAPDEIPLFTTQSAASAFNVSGHPAISVCTGFNPDGLPLNAQFAGAYFQEKTLFAVANAFEKASPWRATRPDLDEAKIAVTESSAVSVKLEDSSVMAARAAEYGRAIERSYTKDVESAAVFKVCVPSRI